jgi:MarR family transcriptional regulator, negative regulator of the multidrug operon emrRAB
MQRDRTANLLGALALALSDAQAAAARDVTGLGPSGCAALVTIGQNDGMTIGGLSRILGLTHSVTVRMVESLALSGLVERRAGTKDKRQVALRLTSNGKARQRAILAVRQQQAASAMVALSAGDRARLDAILEEMLAALTAGRLEADHICRLCDETACTQEACPVEQTAIRIERATR